MEINKICEGKMQNTFYTNLIFRRQQSSSATSAGAREKEVEEIDKHFCCHI